MHTVPILSDEDLTDAHRDYFRKISLILNNKEKYQRFVQLTPLPLPTTSLCESIFQEYPRALHAHNRYIKNTFSSEELEIDFKEYCDSIGFNDFFENEGMDALRKHINSFIVVDLPRQQAGERPQPYMYLLQLEHIIDVDMRPGKPVAEYISFCQDLQPGDHEKKITDRAMVIDDVLYRMFYRTESSGGRWLLDYEVAHNLGECPAFKFYAQVVNSKNPINSQSPITTALGDLEDLLTGCVSVKYYKMYGMFPIYWGYKQKCGYRDERGGECNNEGKVVFYDINGVSKEPTLTDCPKCAAKKMMGPGTFIEVDPPRMKEEADMREPVGFVGVDVDALKFAREDLSLAEAKITYNTTGKTNQETQSKEALNEMDVKRQFETRRNVLMAIKKNFETAMYYAYANMAKLRYADQYVNTVVDLGSEFFLHSEAELNKDYTETKAAGRPAYELAAKREFIYLTRYHNNPDELARLNILQNLEPYQDYTLQELMATGIKDQDPEAYLIKANFYSYIKRFERENLPILQFGSKISFEKKITIIFDKLKTYANEQLQKRNPKGQPQPSEDG
jgi:hypothetical protein